MDREKATAKTTFVVHYYPEIVLCFVLYDLVY
jgi:hypothetical protein